jgi:8-oxo-dGTP pyrophosphatase MutT (NUDIX family)
MKNQIVPGLILAAGGILQSEGRILLVHRARHNDWTVPKGKLDPGESPLQAALREVREETGYTAKAGALAGSIAYMVEDTPKVVLYWRMTPQGRPIPVRDPKEISDIRWVPVGEVLGMLTYAGEREFVDRFLRRTNGGK